MQWTWKISHVFWRPFVPLRSISIFCQKAHPCWLSKEISFCFIVVYCKVQNQNKDRPLQLPMTFHAHIAPVLQKVSNVCSNTIKIQQYFNTIFRMNLPNSIILNHLIIVIRKCNMIGRIVFNLGIIWKYILIHILVLHVKESIKEQLYLLRTRFIEFVCDVCDSKMGILYFGSFYHRKHAHVGSILSDRSYGVLHPWPILWLFMHLSQKLQHIGDK